MLGKSQNLYDDPVRPSEQESFADYVFFFSRYFDDELTAIRQKFNV